MQLQLGPTSVDFIHENGSLQAEINGLRACFGLTSPEFAALAAYLPREMSPRPGYLPLGAFLTALSRLMSEDLAAVTKATSRQRLRELELRSRNYVFLVGFMGRDQLGAHDLLGKEGETPVPDPAAAARELAGFARSLEDLRRGYLDLAEENMASAAGEQRTEYIQSLATSLLDMLQMTCWEYTSWYSRLVAPLAFPDAPEADGAEKRD